MSVPIYQVDAFADRPFTGNPAAVCLLDKPVSDAWMQAVAAEMNLAETAFLYRNADDRSQAFDLRWFTPTTEVDLCGHATLASAHVLWNEGVVATSDSIHFDTRSGVLTAAFTNEGIVLDFPADAPCAVGVPVEIARALGITAVNVERGKFDYLIEVESTETVRALTPDFSILKKIESRGFIVTASGEGEFDFISRFFAPGAGINEDPVTGSAHCCLGPYWQKRLNKDHLLAWQASERGGRIGVRMHADRVFLSGQAVTVLKGSLDGPGNESER